MAVRDVGCDIDSKFTLLSNREGLSKLPVCALVSSRIIWGGNNSLLLL